MRILTAISALCVSEMSEQLYAAMGDEFDAPIHNMRIVVGDTPSGVVLEGNRYKWMIECQFVANDNIGPNARIGMTLVAFDEMLGVKFPGVHPENVLLVLIENDGGPALQMMHRDEYARLLPTPRPTLWGRLCGLFSRPAA